VQEVKVQEVKVQEEVPTPKPRPPTSTPVTQTEALAASRHGQMHHARGFNPLCFPAALVTTVMTLGTLTAFCN
jgi:hypothetical protein